MAWWEFACRHEGKYDICLGVLYGKIELGVVYQLVISSITHDFKYLDCPKSAVSYVN